MKLTIDTSALSDAVTWTAKALAARPPAPILGGILIDAEGNGEVTLSAFDYTVSARTRITADVEEAGTVLIHGTRLVALIKSLRGGRPATLETKGNKLEISSGKTQFTLGLMPTADYPALPATPPSVGTMDGPTFALAVAQVGAATATDQTLPILNNIEFVAEAGDLTLRATDRYCLADKTLDWGGKDFRFLASAKHLAPALTASSTFILHADENLIAVTDGNRLSTALQVDGEFPKIASLFPNQTASTARVETSAIIESIRRAALVAERNTPVRLEFTQDGVTIDAGTGEDAQSVEEADATLEGDPVTVSYNPSFLANILSQIQGDHAEFGFQENIAKPTLITDPDDEAVRFLIMPIRLPKV